MFKHYVFNSVDSLMAMTGRVRKDINFPWGVSFKHSLKQIYNSDNNGIAVFKAVYANE